MKVNMQINKTAKNKQVRKRQTGKNANKKSLEVEMTKGIKSGKALLKNRKKPKGRQFNRATKNTGAKFTATSRRKSNGIAGTMETQKIYQRAPETLKEGKGSDKKLKYSKTESTKYGKLHLGQVKTQ